MILYHLTPKRNVPSIKKLGLLLPKSGRPRIWCCKSELILATLAEHIAQHHRVTVDDLTEIAFEHSAASVTVCHGNWYGFCLIYEPVPPDKIIWIGV